MNKNTKLILALVAVVVIAAVAAGPKLLSGLRLKSSVTDQKFFYKLKVDKEELQEWEYNPKGSASDLFQSHPVSLSYSLDQTNAALGKVTLITTCSNKTVGAAKFDTTGLFQRLSFNLHYRVKEGNGWKNMYQSAKTYTEPELSHAFEFNPGNLDTSVFGVPVFNINCDLTYFNSTLERDSTRVASGAHGGYVYFSLIEVPLTECSDGIDNDGDGLIDAHTDFNNPTNLSTYDPECGTDPTHNDEAAIMGFGGGGELLNSTICGNGITEPPLEECDGQTGCNSTCLWETVPPMPVDVGGTTPGGGFEGEGELLNSAVCGNNTIEGVEMCDDGNAVSGDGCSEFCFLETAPSMN